MSIYLLLEFLVLFQKIKDKREKMKKILLGLMAFLLCFDISMSAPTSKTKTSKTQNKQLGKFKPGSIVDGTPATGPVRRWYFFNEGSVGTSYASLGRSQYMTVDLGYSLYIRSIESVMGGMNFMIGTEMSTPIFIRPMSGSRSNILSDHRFLERSQIEGIAGAGVQFPLMLGFEYKGFYFVGLAGYGWFFMKDTYFSDKRGNFPTIQTQYDGVIYGGGIGYKIRNVVNIGVRYTGGSLVNRGGAQTIFDDAAIANGLDKVSITQQTGRSIHDITYHRIGLFIAVVY